MPELTWSIPQKTLYRYALLPALNGMPWWLPNRWAIALAERRAKAVCDRLIA